MPISSYKPIIRGRGALENPSGRFEKMGSYPVIEDDFPDLEQLKEKQIPTIVFRDTTKSIVTTNDSPDTGVEASVNPYRGCEHGCIYCFARPGHEYFGLSVGVDFETKIFAKPDAPKLLRKKLLSTSWEPKVITMSGNTDPYQPIEKKMKITRGCLEVLEAFRNPVAIITKNHLVTRDIDLLGSLAKYDAAVVNVSITTLDKMLARNMEPRASRPDNRFKAVEELSKAGIPVNVMIGPVLPGLTEHEIPGILKRAADAGACSAGFTILRLPYGVKDIFQTWLKENYPLREQKILNRIRSIRGGKLNDHNFGSRMKGEGFYAEEIKQIFYMSLKRYGLNRYPTLTTEHFRKDPGNQLTLF